MKIRSIAVSVGFLVGSLLAAHGVTACGVPLTVQRIAAAGRDAVLLADGSVWVQGRPGTPPGRALVKLAQLQNIVQLASDGRHFCALQADGRVWQWAPESAAVPQPSAASSQCRSAVHH